MKLIPYILLIIIISTTLSCDKNESNIISLAGTWEIKLDPQDAATKEALPPDSFEGKIKLPGTTDENGYGILTSDTAYGVLSREFEYIGLAHYSKKINIPSAWKDQQVTLFLERVLWESKVFLDGDEISTQDALGTPHIHKMGSLKPGSHLLTIQVNNDMIHNIGDKGHAYGDYMQSIWNGIVGRIELQAKPEVHISQIRTFPDLQKNKLTTEITVSRSTKQKASISLILREKESQKVIDSLTTKCQGPVTRIDLNPSSKLLAWNEFTPFLYEVEATLNSRTSPSTMTTNVGFAKVEHTDHHVLINEEPVFLRGNLDCIHFPLSGYPSPYKQDWLDIFNKYKEFGLNHVRFHSWCPPEAAFDAADELGIYIQAEASLWIDWWMGVDMVERGRPEMNTKGHPQGLGKGDADADEFIWQEMQRVVNTYGNHPSFIMFCIGNELGSSDFNLMGDWIRQLKEADPRRLYAASTARTITEYCDYSATHSVPGVGGVRQKMVDNTNWDYEEKYSQPKVPIIAHEIGQWPVYPDWDEINKYTGPLKARNLEQLANLAKSKGLYEKDELFRAASGSLSALLYKDEIESFMRTPSCGGYQLLSMQDYIGQGEAVIGWLDSFYEEKGNLNAKTARQFISEVVPLVKLPGYCFKSGDTIDAEVLLHQYGPSKLKNQEISWAIKDQAGEIKFSGEFSRQEYSKGQLHTVGRLQLEIPAIESAEQLELSILLSDTEYKNSWPLWFYPKNIPEEKGNILITNKLTDKVLEKLEQGESVLLIANRLGEDDNVKLAAWKPLYWSASFFPGQSIETLGMVVDSEHKAFADFPTENFGSWNWYSICENAHGFDMKDFPSDFEAIVQPISDFHYSRRLGSIFELKYGKGKLMVCGYNISSDRDHIPQVRQLRHSLLSYMNSVNFNPQQEISKDDLEELFSYSEPALSEAPKEFSEASLFVESAALQAEKGNDNWVSSVDNILAQTKTNYSVSADGTWKDDIGTAWFGKEIDIKLDIPSGSIGKVYLFLHDWSNQGRDGTIEIENRKFTIGKHDRDGKWVALNYMREDSQDGEINITVKCISGPNIMITKMAVVF